MTAIGVDRLVIPSPYPVVGVRPRVAMAVLRQVFAAAYADMREMERHVRGSSLKWTIVRLNGLTNSETVAPLRLSVDPLDRPAAMSRASAAAALLNIADA